MLQPLAMLLATSLSQIPDAPKKINLRAFLAGDKMRVKVWRRYRNRYAPSKNFAVINPGTAAGH